MEIVISLLCWAFIFMESIRKCSMCKIHQLFDEFYKSKKLLYGITYVCKTCSKILGKKNNEKIRDRVSHLRDKVSEGNKICFSCKKEKDKSLFYKNKAKSTGLYGSCIECVKLRTKYPKSSDFKIKHLSSDLTNERWEAVLINSKVFPYLISDCGRVKILKSNKIAKPSFDQRGYPQIVLTLNGERVSRRIHCLVGRAFISNPLNLPELNHLDGDKMNINYSNFEWSSHQSNIDHAIKNKLRVPFNSENHPRRKKVIDTSTKFIFSSVGAAAKSFNIKYSTLVAKLNGRLKNDTSLIYLL